MTGIERHWQEIEDAAYKAKHAEKVALLAKLRADHGWALQQIMMLERELEPQTGWDRLQGLAQQGAVGASAYPYAGTFPRTIM